MYQKSIISTPMRGKPVKTKAVDTYPVSLDEAKRHLRIDDGWDKDDDYIRNLIYAATQKCEEYIGKDIAYTTNVLQYWNFVGQDFWIEEGNFNSLTSVKDWQNSTAISTDHTEIYYNRVYVRLSGSADQNPLHINYVTGYSAGECPPIIKQAILVKIGDLYDVERQSYSPDKENYAYQRLLDSYKIILY